MGIARRKKTFARSFRLLAVKPGAACRPDRCIYTRGVSTLLSFARTCLKLMHITLSYRFASVVEERQVHPCTAVPLSCWFRISLLPRISQPTLPERKNVGQHLDASHQRFAGRIRNRSR